MVKLIAPLLSLDARGEMGKTLIYSRIGRTNYAKGYKVPSNPQSAAQTYTRVGTAAITQAWQTLTAAQKALWTAVGTPLKLSAYHAFLRCNTRRWAAWIPPTPIPEPSGTNSPTDYFLSITNVGTLWTIGMTGLHNGATEWGAQICMDTNNPPNLNKETTRVFYTPVTTNGSYYNFSTTWTAPAAGTYYGKVRLISDTGAISQWHEDA